MSAPTWTEYLHTLEGYLEEVRRSVESGSEPPQTPDPPRVDLPWNLRVEADKLASAFAQLASEVSSKLSEIDQRLPADLRARQTPAFPASYVELHG